jgi:hypothetical protein
MKDLVKIGRPLNIEVDRAGRWFVTPVGFVTHDEWENLRRFQSELPSLPLNFPQEFLDSMLRDTQRWNTVPWAAEVDARLRMNPAKGCLWKVDYSGIGADAGHDTIIMGRETLVAEDLGSRLFRPLAEAVCSVVNFAKKVRRRQLKIR